MQKTALNSAVNVAEVVTLRGYGYRLKSHDFSYT